ncbi:hypothetical protein SOM10_02130 [Microbacterium sp. CFBP9023]|uniref:hypothetical protein n=1 Tax=Microbacterium sp. CFBP9023 TaxID=3096535 RepID=UPI002A6A6BF0|nr:hypothetical protein [Microbacterium sp. CFBP9023]MDY0982682.1 hypothetical protein [Microbacterium sp. CFBP9023]
MPSRAIKTFAELDLDVANLLGQHSSTGTVGRPKGDNGPILRSAVVLMATAWENYVELAIMQAFEHVLGVIAHDHSLLVGGVRTAVEAKGKRDPWTLAGPGWVNTARSLVEQQVRELNNAGPGQVDGLIHFAFGLEDFVEGLGWKGQKRGSIVPELAKLINDVRGDIVHKGKTTEPLRKPTVERWRKFLGKLVEAMDRELAAQVDARCGSTPWP